MYQLCYIYRGAQIQTNPKLKSQIDPKKPKTAKNRIFLDVFGCSFVKTVESDQILD
jgi:hypothetical protein